MYKIIELSECLEDGENLSARIGEDEDDITLTIECHEMGVTKKDVRGIQSFLRAVLREAP